MFLLSLTALGLAAIGTYAKPTVRAVGSLEVYLSTPTDKVASASDVRVVSTVKNAGNEDLKILKLGTVLDDEHHTRSFIVSKDGKDVPFTGTTNSVSLDHLSETDWVVIPAGKNVTVEHNAALALYDFSASGPGTFTFDPVSRFQVIGLDDAARTASNTTCTSTANAHSVSITITDVSKREIKFGTSRVFCPGRDIKTIENSFNEAAGMAQLGVKYIKENGADKRVFKPYFGDNQDSTVIDRFNRLIGAGSDGTTISIFCSDPHRSCSGGQPAYTHPSNKYSIFICDNFFDQLPMDALCGKPPIATVGDRKIRGGTIFRMLASLFVPGMVDGGHKCSDSMNLPDPDKATNTDNYDCFAAEVHKITQCPQ